MSWQYQFIKYKTWFNKSWGELTQLRYFAILYFVGDTWLTTRGYSLTLSAYALAFIAFGITFLTIGWIMEKLGLYHAEADFSNDRNPLMTNLKRYLRAKGYDKGEKKKFK